MAVPTFLDLEQRIIEFLGEDGNRYRFYDKDIHGIEAVSECGNPDGIDIPEDVTKLVNMAEQLLDGGRTNLVLTSINGAQLDTFIDESDRCGVPMASMAAPSASSTGRA